MIIYEDIIDILSRW